jgi:stearoyl-CoA desaturase (Delta-9 desaturase)
MFLMSPFWEKFFYLFTYLTQGSSFLNPRAYAILHRMHHAYSDTEKDPHSPHFYQNAFSMMWVTKRMYNDYLHERVAVEDRFSRDIPTWKFIDDLGDKYASRIAWAFVYIAIYVAFATHWWMYLLLPIHFLMGPVHGAIVNWSGHKYGYSNFDNNDKSKNSLPIDFLMGGELFQNNHHKYADKPNFAMKGFEFDPTYPVIKFLDFFRIIKIQKA